MLGNIHSFQSMGAVDGPGLRFVVFMQGCPLRCVYCHNPDTWKEGRGIACTPEEIVQKAQRFVPYFGSEGGITVSGGEPLLQGEFVARLFALLKRQGIHTALDTSGIGPPDSAREVLQSTDLILCDLKFADEERYRENCGGSFHQVLDFLAQADRMGVPVWIRHVVVPHLTDSESEIAEIVRLAERYGVVEKIELLPFRKLCLPKYEALGVPFLLKGTPECDKQTMERLKKLIPERLK